MRQNERDPESEHSKSLDAINGNENRQELVFTTLLHVMGVLPQFREKGLRVLQIPGVKAFGKPTVNRGE
jgi:hypothetical protein